MKMLEGQERCAVESACILHTMEAKLQARHDENFIPVLTRGLLREMEGTGTLTHAIFFDISRAFFSAALNYIQGWGRHNDDLRDLQCLLLKNIPTRPEIEKAVETVQAKCLVVTINEDVLFDEVTYLNAYLKGAVLVQWSAVGAWNLYFCFVFLKAITAVN